MRIHSRQEKPYEAEVDTDGFAQVAVEVSAADFDRYASHRGLFHITVDTKMGVLKDNSRIRINCGNRFIIVDIVFSEIESDNVSYCVDKIFIDPIEEVADGLY